MTKQLSIRSDEAYDIAHRLAKRRGTSVVEVVTQALRDQEPNTPTPEVSPDDAAETIRLLNEFSDRAARAAKPGATSDHSDFYDEHGLPK